MKGDRELANLRQKFYGMFVKLFWKEPDTEFLLSLLDGIAERVRGSARSSPLMSEGWKDIRSYLEKKGADEVEYELVQLFLGPHQPDILPYESYYLSGRVFQAPLAAVRGFMKEVGIEKKEGQLPEPEDTLGFELEIMNWMISKQTHSEDSYNEEKWIDLQARFLKEHLLVWGPACALDIEAAPHAVFYKGTGKLLRGFLEFEKQLFHDLGPEKIESLETLRKRYGSRKEWKGPLFEAVPEKKADS
ncbi:MAG: molecular chaperone TorD family protein [SAR324 cluster bacterium]|nr:molecular chaperone TorD family protein [SAR324 cluster bacterium]